MSYRQQSRGGAGVLYDIWHRCFGLLASGTPAQLWACGLDLGLGLRKPEALKHQSPKAMIRQSTECPNPNSNPNPNGSPKAPFGQKFKSKGVLESHFHGLSAQNDIF